MTLHRSVARSSAHLVTIRGSRVAVQLAIMALTARYFGAEDAGEFALALAMTAPVFVILDLGLRTLYLSRVPHPPYTQLLRVRLAATLCALLVSGALVLVRPTIAPVIVAVAVAKAADLFMELSIGPLQLAGRLLRGTALTVGTGVVVLVVYVVSFPRGFHEALATALVVGAAALSVGSLVLGAAAAGVAEKAARRRPASGLVRDGLALGFGNGIVSLSSSVPQLALAGAFSTVVSGRYAVMLYVVVAGEMLLNAVSQSVLPSVTQRRTTEGADGLAAWADRWMRRGTIFALPAAAAAVGLAWVTVPLIMGDVYRFTIVETVLLATMLTLLPALFIGSVALQALNEYRTTAIISIATLVAVVISSLLLVPAFGVPGALGATIIGTIVRILLARRRWTRAATGSRGEAVAWPSA